MKSLKPHVILPKPEVGDLFLVKTSIDVLDSTKHTMTLKKDSIVQLLEITNTNSPIMLDLKTKFIANWQCKFIYNKRMFILQVRNSCQESMLYEYFQPLTEKDLLLLNKKQEENEE